METKVNKGIDEGTTHQIRNRIQPNEPRNNSWNNYLDIERDLTWLQRYCSHKMGILIKNSGLEDNQAKSKAHSVEVEQMPKPESLSPWDSLLQLENFSAWERLILLTAIAPHFSPGILSSLATNNPLTNACFPQVGGIVDSNNKEFTPTVETIRFLTVSNQIQHLYEVERLLKKDSRLLRKNYIRISPVGNQAVWNKYKVECSEEFLSLIKGEKYVPDYSNSFPASRISTKLDWDDLVLPYDTFRELKEVTIWLKHKQEILNHPELGRFIKPGFRSLFYGPPGTGKTLTASLLGKTTGLDVYRIDLSMVVSKWVGETEKNLKGIFDQAENKNWILFFDEADSLFGKRTQTKSSNDRYANQEVAYLLQRIEDFPGLVILATNMKDNIDEAFSRRFQSMVNFPNPDAENRYTLWKNSLPSDFELEQGIDLHEIAQNHEVSGGIIINVIRYCVLMAMDENRRTILEEDLETGIQKELRKSGRVIA